MAEEKKRQVKRYNDFELSLIKNTFHNNDELLIALRKIFLQGSLSSVEETLIKNLSKETIAVIRKQILPEIDANVPFGQLADLFLGLQTEIKGQDPEVAYNYILAKDKEIKYLNEQLNSLEDGLSLSYSTIKFSDLKQVKGKSKDEVYIDSLVFIFLVNSIDGLLWQLALLAQPEKSQEEQEKEAKLNSAK